MNWDKDKSITLSQVCVWVFALLLLALDVGAYWLTGLFLTLRGMGESNRVLMLISVYSCSVFAWIVLCKLWVLLKNIKAEQVFISENVSILRVVSWCCVAVALICLLSAAYYLPFFIVAMASAFMALIVRIVKNIFQQAVNMKAELDYTV